MIDRAKRSLKLKQGYAKPRLTVFGEFSKLTAAGSTGPTEGQSGQTVKRP